MYIKKLIRQCLIFSTFFFLSSAYAQAAEIKIVSVDGSGNQSNNESGRVSLSDDGRYVVFYSVASNLVNGDTNATSDIFRHDTLTGDTIRVSLLSSGAQLNGRSIFPTISDDGNLITFDSAASAASDDNNSDDDIFLHNVVTGNTVLISKSSTGTAGNNYSRDAAISGNGRYVVFGSRASNLVLNDTNSLDDIFVHDTLTGNTTRVSVSTLGLESNGYNQSPRISSNGRYITFVSSADNLVANDTNQSDDIFLHDNLTGSTTIVSLSSNEVLANDFSGLNFYAPVSNDGRYIAFGSAATNLVNNNNNLIPDIFLRDTQLGVTTRITENSDGIEGNDGSYGMDMSADGHYVVFASNASNLVPNDTNSFQDYFVKDTITGVIKRINVSANGEQSNTEISGTNGEGISISANGEKIGFISAATNLVANDVNGQNDVFVTSTPDTTAVVITPEEQAEVLVTNVIDLHLPNKIENSYLANLYKVEAFIESGQITAAINQLNAFINKVNQDYNQQKITQQVRNELNAAAQQLIDDLSN